MREITVASYNIHGCRGAGGECHPQRIADVLQEIDFGLAGLQEVNSHISAEAAMSHLHFLSEATGAQVVAGPTIKREDSHYGNALLSRFPILEVRHLDLSLEHRESRAAIQALIDVSGKTIRCIVTHLGLRTAERSYQVRKLIEILDEKYQTILLGDINEWLPLARPLWWIRKQFGKTPSLRTFPSRLPLLALDRIWVRPKEALLNIAVHDSASSRKASDHLPIKASIQIM